jgi:hypothetical protein
MKIYVLAEAGEGNISSLITAGSKDKLIEMVHRFYDEQSIAATPEDFEYEQKHKKVLLGMLEQHDSWENGIYNLELIVPHWQEWILMICDEQGSYSYY